MNRLGSRLWRWRRRDSDGHPPRAGRPEPAGAGASRRSQIEECEPRILYSADLNPAQWGDAAGESVVVGREADLDRGGTVEQSLAVANEARRRELVFIDSAIDDLESVLAGIERREDIEYRIVVLEPDGDGLARISAVLATEQGINAVHIVAHGAAGELWLAGTMVDRDGLLGQAAALQAWEAALAPGADLLIYGCEVAAGETGQAFVTALASLSGADVAASADLTGHVDLGGNWILEVATGEVSTSMAFSEQFQVDWQATLATYTVTSTGDTNVNGTLRYAINQANLGSGADVIEFAISGAGPHTITLGSALPIINHPVDINGFSQSGASAGDLRIILNGNGSVGTGLRLADGADGSTIRGLVFQRFTAQAILVDANSNGSVIVGNHIGALTHQGEFQSGRGNAHGIVVHGANNVIGGTTNLARNVIAGNSLHGVLIESAGASNNTVAGNRIGTNVTGVGSIANGMDGVHIDLAHGTTIGGTTAGAGNLISGNGWDGIYVAGTSATDTKIQGNRIGTDATGLWALGNARHGITLYDGAGHTTVGGSAAGVGNLISGNGGNGVTVDGANNPTSEGVVIAGNNIGLNGIGAAELGNGDSGIVLFNGARDVRVGGSTAAERNILSGNARFGLQVLQAATTGAFIQGNYIGVNAAGTLSRANLAGGVGVSAPGVVFDRNLISGNFNVGMSIYGSSAVGNHLTGNLIGVNAAGSAAIGNGGNGVEVILGATSTVIGGTTASERNVISGNSLDGVAIRDLGSANNQIRGNFIGTDATGSASVANGRHGVLVYSGAATTTVGGSIAGAGNLISANGGVGVQIDGGGLDTTSGNVVHGNLIGVDVSGTLDLGNMGSGIVVAGGASKTSIGGTAAGSGNVISGNRGQGVEVFGAATSTVEIQGNTIGLASDGSGSVGNRNSGVYVHSATGVQIGGSTVSARNTISANLQRGIHLVNTPATLVQYNYIGTDRGGLVAAGNHQAGILVDSGTQSASIADNIVSGNQASGVAIAAGATGAVVERNLVGTDRNGTAALANGTGVQILGAQAVVRGNLISGNTSLGVAIRDATATYNLVIGNKIGTDITGTLALANGYNGVEINLGASHNTIGGASAAERNVISGNATDGIAMVGSNTNSNRILGNYIGTDVTGLNGIGNGRYGVLIWNGPGNNRIGGTAAGEGNVISANAHGGISVDPNGLASTSGNHIQGNLIGTDRTGLVARGNGGIGIIAYNATQNMLIGGASEGARNIISGNASFGILIMGLDSTGIAIQGNYIGLGGDGVTALGNGEVGVITSNAAPLLIGGSLAAEGNVISDNGRIGSNINGIHIFSGASGTVIENNRIGTDVTGTLDRGNRGLGVLIEAPGVTVRANLVSGNLLGGILAQSTRTTSGTIEDNRIGTDVSGNTAIGNGAWGRGVLIDLAASGVVVRNNLSSGNYIGISVFGASSNVRIEGNFIGTNAAGTAALANQVGVQFYDGGSGSTIGGEAGVTGNLISGNAIDGISIDGAGQDNTDNIAIAGNRIGVDVSGVVALPNGRDGLRIVSNADAVTIGGTSAAERNVIAGNGGAGILFHESGAGGSHVRGNYIGLGSDGLTPLGNGAEGVLVNRSPAITVGGSSAAFRNIIVANSGDGIHVLGATSTEVVIIGNYIGLGPAGDAASAVGKGNSGVGIRIADGAQVRIGGPVASESNVIAANAQGGIVISDAVGVVVQGNRIGVDAAGNVAIGNGASGSGIRVAGSGAHQIGGPLGASGNLVSGHGRHGIVLAASSSGSTVQGNYVGTNVSGDSALANAYGGILVEGSSHTIGGITLSAGNLISGNAGAGLTLTGNNNTVLGNMIGVDVTAVVVLANGGAGIVVSGSATGNRIGSATSSGANRIIGNGGRGIVVTDSASLTAILVNVISGNGGLAIDLNDDGVTANDPGDADSGPNGLQNFPVLNSYSPDGGSSIRIQGELDSAAETAYRLDFYGNSIPDVSGHGGAQRFLGTTSVVTDETGKVSFDVVLTGIATMPSEVLSATATVDLGSGNYGATSELALNRALNRPPVITSNGGGASASLVINEGHTAVTTGIATDPDLPAQTLTWSLGGVDAALFTIDPATGFLQFLTAPQYATPLDANGDNVYQVLIQVSDGLDGVDSQALSITVGGNVGPVSDNNPAPNAVAENSATGASVGLTAWANDPDAGDTVSYSLDDDADGRFAIHASTGVVTVADGSKLDFEAATSHEITVLATSSDGSTSTAIFTIAVLDINEPIDALSDVDLTTNQVNENAAAGTLVGITARASDPDAGDTITYSLDDDADGRFAIHATTGVVTVADGTKLDFETSISHQITVLATSSDSSTSTADYTIAILDVNEPVGPVTDVDPAPDQVNENAAAGAVVGITALAVDPDGTNSTVTYSLDDDADGRFAIHATTGVVTVADGTKLDYETDAAHQITVVATSADGSASTADFTIAVVDVNEPIGPVSDANPAPDQVNENAATGSVVGITALAVDPDGSNSSVIYSLSDDADGRFAIHATTGVVTVADGTKLDYETDAAHQITVVATSADGSASTADFTIAVVDLNEPVGPVSDAEPAPDQVNENAANGTVVGITALAVDPDGMNNSVTYSLSDDADGRFAIHATTGVVTVADGTKLDYETDAAHQITVVATSADGSTSTASFTIAVLDVNEPVGPVNDVDSALDQVNENAATGTVVGITALAVDPDGTNNTVTYGLSDDADGRFAIHATTGVVTVADGTRLDYETDAVHQITVVATSADGSTSTADFTIAILDVNEPVGPVNDVDSALDQVNENAAAGTVVGITALAVDPDGTNNTVTYSLSDDADGRFAIHATTGVVTVVDGTKLDYETDAVHQVAVVATSADGSTSTADFTIAVVDVNEPVGPVSDVDSALDQVNENATTGTVVGITALAVDPDATNNTITYSLGDDADGRFAIHATTGVVTVTDGTKLDYETDAAHQITVVATSADGSTSTADFTIAVLDVNEPIGPVSDVDSALDQVNESATTGTVVGITALAVDPDATSNTITYSLGDDADGRFAIHATTGVVTVADGTKLDYETDAAHQITVVATSADGTTSTADFTIAVVDVNEPIGPVSDANPAPDQVNENAATGSVVGITALAVDPDGSNNTVTYSLSHDADGRFAIHATTGVVTVADGTKLDYETDAAHQITVVATSADGSTSAADFTIAVVDVNEPVGLVSDVDPEPNQINENVTNGTVVGITALAVDPDGTNNSVTYSLSDDADGRFAIHATTGVVTVADGTKLDYETDAAHQITVVATSADGSTSTASFIIAVLDVNEPVGPVSDANPAPDQVSENAAAGTVVGITALAVDPDGTNNTVTYSLSDDADGRFAIHATTGVVTVADGTKLDYETDAAHQISVLATSADGTTSTASFTIVVLDVNEPIGPVSDVDSALDQVNENATTGTVVGITALAVDPDGTNNSVTYSLSDNADGRFAIHATTGAVTVADGTKLDYETDAAHQVTVVATSADGSTSTADFTIAVLDVNEPIGPVSDVDSVLDQVNENATTGTVVGITALAVDPDGTSNSVTYSLSDNADGRFAIHATMGVVTVADGSRLDYETDAAHQIAVVATSADGSTSTANFAIAILDVNEPVGPLSDVDSAPNQVNESAATGTVVGITALAVDPDGTNSTVTYSLSDDADGRFAIHATTGVVTVADGTKLDYETDAAHQITVVATSADGSTSTADFTIAVVDVNEPVGPVSDVDSAPNQVNENATTGTVVGITVLSVDPDATNNTVTYSLSDDADGRFAIHATTGVVTVADGMKLDYETDASHQITVVATSADSSTSTADFTISVVDVNEPVGPVSDANPAPDQVNENAAAGTVVGITALAVDPDGSNSSVIYSLSDDADGRFAIHATTGVVTVADGTKLDYETDAVHQITVVATSADGSTSTADITIAVVDVNEPVGSVSDVDSALDQVNENAAAGTVVGITALAIDPDGTNNTVTYSLSDNADGRFAIDSATGVVTVADGTKLDYETDAAHQITVIATSADGSTSTADFTIAILDVNEPVGPVNDVDSALDQVNENAAAGTVVGITALAVDPDGTNNTVTYSLGDDADGRFAIHATTGVVTVTDGTKLDYETDAAHQITVLATSADGSTSTADFTISVVDVNEPIGRVNDVDSALDQVNENATTGTVVGITALAVDPDGTNSTVTYSLSDDAHGRFAIHATTGVVTVADGTKLDYELDAAHQITVVATSADGSTSTADFTIAILDFNEPVGPVSDVDSAPDQVNENASTGTVVGIAAQAIDPDGTNNTVTYSLSDNADGRFAIDSATGVVTVADGTKLDYETDAAHQITVVATSADGSTSTADFTIAVVDVNEPVGPVSDSDAELDQANENATTGTVVGITALAVDPDATNNTVTYSLSDDADGRFAIHAMTGVVTVADGTKLDYETDAAHQISVVATSADGSTSTADFAIAILDVNEPIGPVSDVDSAPDQVSENAATGTVVGIIALAVDPDGTNNSVTYSLSDDADGRFAIHVTTGVVTVADGTKLDYETDAVHQITVVATSADGSASTADFTIAVVDLNEPVGPVSDAEPEPNQVNENAANGTVVGITALAVDPDATNNTITYSLGDDADGRFAIHATTGVVTVADGTKLDYETDAAHQIAVVATSADGSTSTASFTIAVLDVNEPIGPVNDVDSALDQVNENAATGTVVGITALAVDPDGTSNTVIYSLSDDADGRFAIHATTGVVTVANGSKLDYETDAVHQLTVVATSADSSTSTATFTIAVLDVNEPVGPVSDANPAPDQVNENAATGTVVGITALAVDPDGTNNSVTYSLSDNADGRFAIHATTGVVTVADGTKLDYELDAAHQITVVATSADGSTSTADFTIAILDVNEPVGPVSDVDSAPNQVNENAVSGTVVGITALAVDPDGTNNTVIYGLSDDADGRFAIHATTGVVTVADGTRLDYETDAVHQITVVATSADSSTSTATFTIAVLDVNEPIGPVNDVDSALDQVNENVATGTAVGITASAVDPDGTNNSVTYSLSGDADGRFAIHATTGVVTVADGTKLDYETDAAHQITVVATSADGSTSTTDFTIAVLDVNEPVGPVSDRDAAPNQVRENADAGTEVGIVAFAEDPDGADTVSYSLVDSAEGRFRIDATSGVVSVAAGANLDYELTNHHSITVLASSGDGSESRATFTISVIDINEFQVGRIEDRDPRVDAVDENAVAGTEVGIQAQATDRDGSGNAIRYDLTDDGGGRFQIDPQSGVVTVRAGAVLDRERDAFLDIVVRASSADGSMTERRFTIALRDVNEFDLGPVVDVDPGDNVVRPGIRSGDPVGITVRAEDRDATGNRVRYRLDDDAGGRFAIDSLTGVITVANQDLLAGDRRVGYQIAVGAISEDGSASRAWFDIALVGLVPSEPEQPGKQVPPLMPPVVVIPSGPPPVPPLVVESSLPPTGPGVDGTRTADSWSGIQQKAGIPVNEAGSALGEPPSTLRQGPSLALLTAVVRARELPDWQWLPFDLLGAASWEADLVPVDLVPAQSIASPSSAEYRDRAVEIESLPATDSLDPTGRGFHGDLMSDPMAWSGTALTAGFVWWLTRGGGLLTMILMGLPTWRHIDLLPVVARQDDRLGDEDELTDPEDESLDPRDDARDDDTSAGRGQNQSSVEAKARKIGNLGAQSAGW